MKREKYLSYLLLSTLLTEAPEKLDFEISEDQQSWYHHITEIKNKMDLDKNILQHK